MGVELSITFNPIGKLILMHSPQMDSSSTLVKRIKNLTETFDKSPIIVYQPQKCPQLTDMN
jgi:hypothetical protein